MCTESPLDPFPPSNILEHDLDWLASTASERETQREGEREDFWLLSYEWVRQRENQQNRTNVDANQQQESETLMPPARLHQGGENKTHLVVYMSQTVR